MAYEEKTKPEKKMHTISLDNRCRLSVTGVEEVESFDEAEIIMSTSQGDLIVRGGGLHIGKINLDVGELRVEGTINELCYEEHTNSTGFLRRLFA